MTLDIKAFAKLSMDELLRRERRTDRLFAKALARAVASGEVETFLQAVDRMAFTVDGWRLAMLAIGRLPAVSSEIQAAFRHVWAGHKHLPLAIGHRPTTARALRLLMPPCYDGAPLPLYRGTTGQERQRRLYGFSWSTSREVATAFADTARRWRSGGVLLMTLAPPEAVLLVREDGEHDDEAEVVVDPFRLGRVALLQRLSTTAP